MNKHRLACIAVGLALFYTAAGSAAPTAGETYVYRVINAYNNLVLGKIQYRVDKVEADRVAVSVATDVAALGGERSEIYNGEGNWLRHALINRDNPVDYEFAQPYAAYAFPLDTGKSWSVRVNAVNPATGQRNSVRVDGNVVGAERITVPAGSFDTLKIRRLIYAGDWDAFKLETKISETEWYAPALGRAVRKESKSEYFDGTRSRGGSLGGGAIMPGDWHVFELLSTAK